MVEVLEYSLVLVASSMVVGGSFLALSSFSNMDQSLENRAALESLNSLALRAVEQGHSTMFLRVSDSTITCSGGLMSLNSSFYSGAALLPAGCDFTISGLNGGHMFEFEVVKETLVLRVS